MTVYQKVEQYQQELIEQLKKEKRELLEACEEIQKPYNDLVEFIDPKKENKHLQNVTSNFNSIINKNIN